MSRARTRPRGGGSERGPARRDEPSRFDAPKSAEAIESAVKRVFAPERAPRGRRARERIADHWARTLRTLSPLGGMSVGNALELLFDGDRVFEAIWAEIAGARRRVLLDTYTWEPDRVGTRTRDELVAAAERGCEVAVLFDSFGSYRLGDDFLEPLRAAGAQVLAFNPVLRLRPRFPRLMRNHKKIIVVDDRVAYCGGMNIADDYAGLRLGTGLFRDTQLRVRGPGVRDLAALVLRSMRDVAGEAPGIGAAPEPFADGSFAQVLASDVRRDVRAIQKALRYTVLRAGERCYLSSPYFVPQARLMRALRKAARRGVDVRVLTAGRSDVPLVTLASRHLYGRLIRAGVRIWEMQGQTLHAKTVSIDGVYGGVGSFNLDRWSARRNLEVGVGFLDRPVAGELERSFLADLEGSEEVGLERWSRRGALARFVSWLAYWIVRL